MLCIFGLYLAVFRSVAAPAAGPGLRGGGAGRGGGRVPAALRPAPPADPGGAAPASWGWRWTTPSSTSPTSWGRARPGGRGPALRRLLPALLVGLRHHPAGLRRAAGGPLPGPAADRRVLHGGPGRRLPHGAAGAARTGCGGPGRPGPRCWRGWSASGAGRAARGPARPAVGPGAAGRCCWPGREPGPGGRRRAEPDPALQRTAAAGDRHPRPHRPVQRRGLLPGGGPRRGGRAAAGGGAAPAPGGPGSRRPGRPPGRLLLRAFARGPGGGPGPAPAAAARPGPGHGAGGVPAGGRGGPALGPGRPAGPAPDRGGLPGHLLLRAVPDALAGPHRPRSGLGGAAPGRPGFRGRWPRPPPDCPG